MSAALTRAALRGLRLPPDELEAKLGSCSDSTREKLSGELGAIQWALTMCMVWHEQGVLDEVLEYIEERCDAETEVPAGV